MSIANAIRGRHCLRFTYDGQSRVVEPHTFGMDRKGQMALRAYQLSGGSRSGKATGWKMFHADAMHDVEVLVDTFPYPHPGHRNGEGSFWSIHAEC